MKKIILSLSAVLLFASIPASAQSTQQKANEINVAGKSAAQSQSATDARATQNAVWDGSAKSSGTAPDAKGGQIDIIGGNENIDPQKDEESTFDAPESKDVTPWKGLLTGLVSTIMSSMAMLATASLFMYFASMHETDPTGHVFAEKMQRTAQYIASAAVLALIAAAAMATILIVKHKQYLLGSLWLGCATLGLASGISLIVGTSKLRGTGWYMQSYKRICTTLMITTMAVAAIGLGGGGYLAYRSYKQADKTQQQSAGNEKTSALADRNILYFA